MSFYDYKVFFTSSLPKIKRLTVIYALNQKVRMMNVLEDCRLILSNNLVKRETKILVMEKKLSVFYIF